MRQSALIFCLAGAFLLLAGGCKSLQREAPRPGRTSISSPLVVLPAETIGNYLIVEGKWDRHGPYHFLVDTGSSVTHVSPELAERYRSKNIPPAGIRPVMVKSAAGDIIKLPEITLSLIKLGDARFEDVPVLIYDCTPLSDHLGIKIDGILGFPLFRDTLMTLDYPQSRIIISPYNPAALVPGRTIAFNNDHRTPQIPLDLGQVQIDALIDSGSDAALNLNPQGLTLDYAVKPRPAVIMGTLSGDHLQYAARLQDSLSIGDYVVRQPLVYLTDGFTSLGGDVLRHFSLTFDQERNRVTIYRESRDPIYIPAKRSTGLTFSKTPAYWRVAGVVPDTPASVSGVQAADLVSRINGEPITQWNLGRYEQLIREASEITYTFLSGTTESSRTLQVIALVP
jgi:hypothetical protein|uniref:aspartyl protease family protein n=1 Tax=Cephaloticoccus sp. TaxID=1985742 RepID=UPI00404A7523